jgi:hypothetical protein
LRAGILLQDIFPVWPSIICARFVSCIIPATPQLTTSVGGEYLIKSVFEAVQAD